MKRFQSKSCQARTVCETKKSEAFKRWPFFFLITERYFALFQLFPPKFSINFIIFLPFVFFRVSPKPCLVSIPWEFHIFLLQMFGIIVRIRKGNSARSLILEHVHEIDDQRISHIHFLVMFFLNGGKQMTVSFPGQREKTIFTSELFLATAACEPRIFWF